MARTKHELALIRASIFYIQAKSADSASAQSGSENKKTESTVSTRIFLSFWGSQKSLFKAAESPGLYLEEVYLVTALVPSETACLANSPGRRRRTAVWISRDVMVDRLL